MPARPHRHYRPYRAYAWPLAPLLALALAACNPADSGPDAFNAARVKFSEGSPAADGQTLVNTGSVLSPSLEKIKYKMIFHVIADNTGNSERASFGTDEVKPIVKLYINSRSQSSAIPTTIPAFAVAGGAKDTLDFPIEVPLSLIDKATIGKIADGDPIPYFLTGSLNFNLFDGTVLKGTGTSELDLASGELETRPSGSILTLLSGLL